MAGQNGWAKILFTQLYPKRPPLRTKSRMKFLLTIILLKGGLIRGCLAIRKTEVKPSLRSISYLLRKYTKRTTPWQGHENLWESIPRKIRLYDPIHAKDMS